MPVGEKIIAQSETRIRIIPAHNAGHLTMSMWRISSKIKLGKGRSASSWNPFRLDFD